jgi:branched-chain amino acid transport system ATP-binding protein
MSSAQPSPSLSDGLSVRGLNAGYGRKTVLQDVSLDVARGEIVALLGVNGAGKTTFLKTVIGLLSRQQGAIHLGGEDIARRSAAENARGGLVLVPEGARSFHDLTVRENLHISSLIVRDAADFRRRYEEVLECFPNLTRRLGQKAGVLSGGERQMLAIGRALILRPRILLLDEPFLGLAPVMIAEVVRQLHNLKERLQCGILIAEQHVPTTLKLCDRAFVVRDHGMHAVGREEDGADAESKIVSLLLGTSAAH